MKTVYLLPFLAVSLFAHQGNELYHYHVSDYMIFATIGIVSFITIKILKRRDV